MRPRDTSPDAWAVYIDLIRAMPAAERIRRAMSLSKTVRQLTEAHLRKQYPNASEREIFLRSAQVTLGKELFARVYGAEAPWLARVLT